LPALDAGDAGIRDHYVYLAALHCQHEAGGIDLAVIRHNYAFAGVPAHGPDDGRAGLVGRISAPVGNQFVYAQKSNVGGKLGQSSLGLQAVKIEIGRPKLSAGAKKIDAFRGARSRVKC